MVAKRERWYLLSVSGLLQFFALLAVNHGWPLWVGAPIVLTWALLVPGFAYIGCLDVTDRALLISLSTGLSVSLGIAVAQTSVWLGSYSVELTTWWLATLGSAGLALQMYRLFDLSPVEP